MGDMTHCIVRMLVTAKKINGYHSPVCFPVLSVLRLMKL